MGKLKEIKSTESFLENNLSEKSSKINKEEEKNENSRTDEIINKNRNENNINQNREESLEVENPNEIKSKRKKIVEKRKNSVSYRQEEEIIFIRQLIAVNYIQKIRHKNIKIHNLMPKKNRLFITKIINPKNDEFKNKEQEEKPTLIPISTLCYTTKHPLIKGKIKYLTTVNNGYCFSTKLHINKEKEKKNLDDINDGKNTVKNKYPCKLYRKAILSPNKINLLRSKKKLAKIKNSKYSSANKNNFKNDNKSKKIKKQEKISLISRDKSEVNSSRKEDSKDTNNNNLILKNVDKGNNNNLENKNNEFSDDTEANRIDISIHFSNTPLNIDYNNNNQNLKKIKNKPRFHSTTKTKNKNITDSLLKDLHEINSKLENKEEYFKHYHLDYPRHIGLEETCPICKEVRKKGKLMEKEKGLFSALSFRNFKTLNRRTLNKLKLSKQNSQYKKINLLNDVERKKKNKFSWNNLNNMSQQNLEFRKKYLEFNDMNRLNKYNRYGSVEDNRKYRNTNNSRNNKDKILNDGILFEKKDDVFNSSEYPLLKNYFHNNDYNINNDYFN